MSPLQRFPDWPERLAVFIRDRESLPFNWVTHNCALVACDSVLEMTGTDLAEAFRGKFTTKFGAIRAVLDYCGGGLEELADKISREHEIPEINPNLAQRGDVLLVKQMIPDVSDVALAIMGMNAALATSPAGLTRMPRSSWLRAWRIG